MQNNHYPRSPIPINIVELFDGILSMRVNDNKAEIIHDGSKKYVPFRNPKRALFDKDHHPSEDMIPIQSKKYKKSYLVDVGKYKVIIKLIFDKRANIGWIRVTKEGWELLKQYDIVPEGLRANNTSLED